MLIHAYQQGGLRPIKSWIHVQLKKKKEKF